MDQQTEQAGGEKRYRVTLHGRGIRRRCRAPGPICTPLGYTDALEVPAALRAMAADHLRSEYRAVSEARVAVTEVTVYPWGHLVVPDSPAVEADITAEVAA